jgi:3-oxoacyl-(acyl-carrier-protein) synthase
MMLPSIDGSLSNLQPHCQPLAASCVFYLPFTCVFHLCLPPVSSTCAMQVVRLALSDAKLAPADVATLEMHGTGGRCRR